MNRRRYTRLPTEQELIGIPLSVGAEFELNEKEVRQLRAHLYAINKDGIRRYRTMRDGTLLLVWRIK